MRGARYDVLVVAAVMVLSVATVFGATQFALAQCPCDLADCAQTGCWHYDADEAGDFCYAAYMDGNESWTAWENMWTNTALELPRLPTGMDYDLMSCQGCIGVCSEQGCQVATGASAETETGSSSCTDCTFVAILSQKECSEY